MVNSHITVTIIIFQPGFLESNGNTALIRRIVSSVEMLEVCTLFELVEIESAKSVNLEHEIIVEKIGFYYYVTLHIMLRNLSCVSGEFNISQLNKEIYYKVYWKHLSTMFSSQIFLECLSSSFYFSSQFLK